MGSEHLIAISEVVGHLPFRASPAMVQRLIRHPGSHGVVLETIKIGNRRYTSREAIYRFIAMHSADTVQEDTGLSPIPHYTPVKNPKKRGRKKGVGASATASATAPVGAIDTLALESKYFSEIF